MDNSVSLFQGRNYLKITCHYIAKIQRVLHDSVEPETLVLIENFTNSTIHTLSRLGVHYIPTLDVGRYSRAAPLKLRSSYTSLIDELQIRQATIPQATTPASPPPRHR